MGHRVPATLVIRERGDNPPPAAMLSTHFGGPVATILLARAVRADQEPPLHHWAAPTLGQLQSFSSATVTHRAVVLGRRGSGSTLRAGANHCCSVWGIVRKWRERNRKRGWHPTPKLSVYFSDVNWPCQGYPGSIQPNTEHRYEKRESNTFKNEPCKTAGKGVMHETRPEAGEIIPSSGGQKRKLNIISFLEREPASLNFRALGQLFPERCCSWFFVLSFLFSFSFFPPCI